MSGVVVPAVDASSGTTAQKAVTTAGTAVQLTTDGRRLSVGANVRALSANTGKIYVGFVSNIASTTGHELVPGESLLLEVSKADGIYINSTVNGEGVCFTLI